MSYEWVHFIKKIIYMLLLKELLMVKQAFVHF